MPNEGAVLIIAANGTNIDTSLEVAEYVVERSCWRDTMHLQKVQNPPLKAIQGVLAVVLGLIAVIVLASVVLQLLSPWIGAAAASIVFWVVGIGVALWTTRRFHHELYLRAQRRNAQGDVRLWPL